MAVASLPTDQTDGELMSRVARGDQGALARLYDRHGATAYALAMRITGSPEAAEDAVRKSFDDLWRGRGPAAEAGGEGSLCSRLMRAVIHAAIDRGGRAAAERRLGLAITYRLGAGDTSAAPALTELAGA